MSKPVPNQMPASDPGDFRLALCGESPGADEVLSGRPFSGPSGFHLDQWLASCGVTRAQVFVGNVSQCRPSPTSNDFHLLEWTGPEIQAGIAALQADLTAFRPHCVLAMGNAALHLLRHGNVAPPKSQKRGLFQWTSHVGTWRGSLFLAASSFDAFDAADLRAHEKMRYETLHTELPRVTGKRPIAPASAPYDGGALGGASLDPRHNRETDCTANGGAGHERTQGSYSREMPSRGCLDSGAASPAILASANLASPAIFKCLGTYHPAATFRDPSLVYPLVSDIRRAVEEARSPALVLPARRIAHSLPLAAIEERIAAIRFSRAVVGFDIEGGLKGLQCCSFATTPADAFVIDLMAVNGDGPALYRALASVLEDPAVPKVCWNAAYERAVLECVAGIHLRGYEDGMLAWWERFSELPKGLDFVASLLTREPYWAEGIGWDKKTGAPKASGEPFWRYNCLDSMTSLEIWQHATVRGVVEARQPVPFELAP